LLAQLLDVWAFTGTTEASGTSSEKAEKIDFDMGNAVPLVIVLMLLKDNMQTS
jgi:hypothetical protein